MSMKIFTLSAVCVLVFSLMIALSGTTRFPDYSEQGHLLQLGEGSRPVVSMMDAAPGAGTAPPKIQDWGNPRDRSHTTGSDQTHTGGNETRPVPWVAILFILLWIFLSVRLLSTD